MATDRDALRDRLDRATAYLDPPVAAVDLTTGTPTSMQWRRYGQRGRHRSRPRSDGGGCGVRPLRADAVRRLPGVATHAAAFFALPLVRRGDRVAASPTYRGEGYAYL